MTPVGIFVRTKFPVGAWPAFTTTRLAPMLIGNRHASETALLIHDHGRSNVTIRFHYPSHVLEWSDPNIGADFDGVWSLVVRGLGVNADSI